MTKLNNESARESNIRNLAMDPIVVGLFDPNERCTKLVVETRRKLIELTSWGGLSDLVKCCNLSC